ncbi:WD40 repeat-like protein [Calocera cornea HHB12733]|uniref:WD40 repeat-like protein n=1 Tax=Calocera cornea HHB12733 TaxID=1353952 RepID=A0A165F9I4_9BASI|nr:WD40 repeat-like protein [Calocera cornea HHB12733]
MLKQAHVGQYTTVIKSNMQTTDPGLLFRSEADLQRDEDRKTKLARMQQVGDPIALGNSKPLSIHVEDDMVWTAESNGMVVKRDLETNTISRVFRGHRGPVSALCVCQLPWDSATSVRRLVISGSWDKHIRIFDDESGSLLSDTEAHTDFVKAITYLTNERIIVSGGSDKEIRFWELPSQAGEVSVPVALKSIGFVREHVRPIASLLAPHGTLIPAHTMYSADSMGVLLEWRLDVIHDDGKDRRVRATKVKQLRGHSTGINGCCFNGSQLWTGSSDNLVILHRLDQQQTKAIHQTQIPHPSAVKSLLPLSTTVLQMAYLIAGCSDEKIWVWDTSAVEDGSGPPCLLRTLDVHSHEISGLALWLRRSDVGGREPWIVSASLDGTVRKWKLSDLLSQRRVSSLEPLQNAAPTFELTEEEERELLDLE